MKFGKAGGALGGGGRRRLGKAPEEEEEDEIPSVDDGGAKWNDTKEEKRDHVLVKIERHQIRTEIDNNWHSSRFPII